MQTSKEPTRARRIELILNEIDSLPTLPTVATRLLTLTTSDDSNAREVTELISSDMTLTGKILSLCRKASLGVRSDAVTIDKAVVLLGFDAIRTAVLSIKVFDIFDSATRDKAAAQGRQANGDGDAPEAEFDRTNFWRHSLAVGVAAELLVAANPGRSDMSRSEAFVCGLMHDLGKLALDYLLPKAYNRVIELTELNHGNIAEFERRVIGLDHHTAGKRLAEQWQLPQLIMDCMWLHGTAYESLPRLDHRGMVGVVGLADLIVRQQHIGYSGNFTFDRDPADLAKAIGLDPETVKSIGPELYKELQRREDLLELDGSPSRELYLESIQRANEALGRLNTARERRSRLVTVQSSILDAITDFHAAAWPGRSTQDVLDAVAASSVSVFDCGYCAMLYQTGESGEDGEPVWLIRRYDENGQPAQSQFLEPPAHAPDLSSLDPNTTVPLEMMRLLPWIADYIAEPLNVHKIKMMPLSNGWGTSAVLLHDQEVLPPSKQLRALISCWGSAITAASQYEGAQRLSEDLAESHRALAEAQDKLLNTQSMARLGEMAAGAAHEMNNPLAVISGRSQLLMNSLDPASKHAEAARTISEQSHRLSDLITSLRMFADPPTPKGRPTDVGSLLDETVRKVREKLTKPTEQQVAISVKVQSSLPPIVLDPDQISLAVQELLLNAIQSGPKKSVTVNGLPNPDGGGLLIQVSDDGQGMNGHTLAHAMDPFFSAKPAGRQVGMGLARAKQLIEVHGGRLELRSAPNVGTVASIVLPLHREQ